MSWQQIIFHLDKEYLDNTVALLQLLDAQTITMLDGADQPLFATSLDYTPRWEHPKLTALFTMDTDIHQIHKFLSTHIVGFHNFSIEIIAEEDWQKKSLESFKPIKISEKLWICPSWCKLDKLNTTIVNLDPGLAFGTGTHETTTLCLQWLAHAPLHDKTVIDYGCGSGILAITAAMLGASNVWAVDHDPQAIIATKNNIALNSVIKNKIETMLSDTKTLEAVDYLLANILCEPLLSLAPLFAQLVKKNGTLILSGILASQIDEISQCYCTHFTITHIETLGDWVRIEALRNE